MISRSLFQSNFGGVVFIGLAAALAIMVPILHLAVPEDSFFHVSTSTVVVFGKYLCFALVALSLDLIWGYCGILSLGHAAFFALGGYAMGLYLKLQTSGGALPDFMVFLNWKELPWYWYGFDHLPFALIMALFVPGILAFVCGYFAFRSRVTGVYLSIITQLLTYALWLAFFRNDMGFGGNNGLTDFRTIAGYSVQAPETRAALFSLTAIALIVSYLIAKAIVDSKLGKVLLAIRDAESRTRFIGYRVEAYKTFVFTVAAMMAGVAGALYVPQVGIINPGEYHPANSIEMVIWVAAGGRATLIGAAFGAVLVNFLKTIFTTGFLAPYWLFALGALFIFVTVFLPKGIVGTIGSLDWRSMLAVRRSHAGANVDVANPKPAE